jgi:hypothetical protein
MHSLKRDTVHYDNNSMYVLLDFIDLPGVEGIGITESRRGNDLGLG